MGTERPIWRSHAWLVAAVVLGLLALLLMATGYGDRVSQWATFALAVAITATVLGWALLRTRAQRRAYEAELAAWAAERATQAERIRIARELHDLVSHGLGLITLRVAAARAAVGPGAAAERAGALADVERASRETTTELRRMLEVLRGSRTAPLQPADSLADLPAIVQQATDAGLSVTLEVADVAGASAGVQLTVCAIVREGLTNIGRHAGPTDALVRIERDGDAICVEIRDAGPSAGWEPRRGAGHGLVGLRERLHAFAGDLTAGPHEGGWRLQAQIPDQVPR